MTIVSQKVTRKFFLVGVANNGLKIWRKRLNLLIKIRLGLCLINLRIRNLWKGIPGLEQLGMKQDWVLKNLHRRRD